MTTLKHSPAPLVWSTLASATHVLAMKLRRCSKSDGIGRSNVQSLPSLQSSFEPCPVLLLNSLSLMPRWTSALLLIPLRLALHSCDSLDKRLLLDGDLLRAIERRAAVHGVG